MKTESENIDQLIKKALNKEEAEYYEQLEEQNFFQEYGGLFKGRNGFLTAIATVFIFGFIAVIVWSFIQFFQSETTKEIVLYALIIIGAFISISMLKMWHYMQMDKNAILREMKRLELQISALAESKN